MDLRVALVAEIDRNRIVYTRKLIPLGVFRVVILHHLAQIFFVIACVSVVIHTYPASERALEQPVEGGAKVRMFSFEAIKGGTDSEVA